MGAHSELRREVERAWEDQHTRPKDSHAAALAALARAEAAREEAAAAWAHLTIGYYELRYLTVAEARRSLEAAARGMENVGDRRGALLAANGLARVLSLEGDPESALAIFRANLADTDAPITPLDRFYTLNGIAGSLAALGDTPQALGYLYEALAQLRSANARPQLATLLANLGNELMAIGDHDEALRMLEEAQVLVRELEHPRLRLAVTVNLAECLLHLGRGKDALPHALRALGDPEAVHTVSLEGSVFAPIAQVLIANGQRAEAEEAVRKALETVRVHDNPATRSGALLAQGLALARWGAPAAAIATLEQARAALPEPGPLPLRCLVLSSLAEQLHRAGRDREAYQIQREYFAAYEKRLGIASRARYFVAQIHFELTRIREERDAADRVRRQAEEANERLAALNVELQQKILHIEELQSELREQAVRDPLTGLYNRRYLDSVLANLVALFGRTKQPLAVAMLDLDRFKDVNDRHGHLFGDRVLVALARVLQSGVRAADIVCRYGGEEFCLLFPNAGAAEAAERVEALLATFRETTVSYEGTTLSGIAFSAGIAAFPRDGHQAEALLAAADRALYEAKETGRNRVCVARPGAVAG